jgi:formate hydrogenlyase transcriptional activator
MEEIKDEFDFEHIIGRSASIKKVLGQVRTVAKSDSTVFITGETGTGKELVARAIHSASKRSGRPLIKANCAAIPSGLVESELFGHEKGSFTGAFTRRIGRFEQANGGTLFLDEVGELTPDLQAKLLRVLQEREFERIGGRETIKTDVRLVAATNQDVSQAIKDGKCRSDLYYRLNVIPIHIPALRERRDEKHGARIARSFHRINPSTMAVLKAYSWPGNVRELENIIERAVLLSPGRTLQVHDDLPLTITSPRPAEDTLAAVEKRHIRAVLQRTNGLISGPNGAAVILGLHPNTLRSRCKSLVLRFGNFGSKRDAS